MSDLHLFSLPSMFTRLAPVACAAVLACASSPEPEPESLTPVAPAAHAALYNSSGEIVGDAILSPINQGVAIELEVYDLPPGSHGFHIHETGDCNAPGFKSAGGHFDPFGADHGFGDDPAAHLGDLPNLPVDEDREMTARVFVDGVTLAPEGTRSLLDGDGTALVVHARGDDYQTDPAGAAGPRIACGVIEAL